MKEIYPEKIDVSRDENAENAEWGIYTTSDDPFVDGEESVSYTRSDLVEKLTSLPKWHKYPDEKPTENDIYLAITSRGEYYILEYVDDGDSWKWYDGLRKFKPKVAYWQELPEPYKEDES